MKNWADPLWLWNQKSFLWVNHFAESKLDYVFGWTTYFGNVAILLPTIFLYLLIWDRKQPLKNFLLVCLATIGASGLGQWLKTLAHHPRPFLYFSDQMERGQAAVHVLFGLVKSHSSFPSGHVVAIFAAATALVYLYGRRVRFLYLLAALVGISRIYVGAHFPLDVIAGAAVGSATSWGILKLWDRFAGCRTARVS